MRTGRIAVLGALATAGALCLGSSAALAQTIVVGNASGDAGQQVTVTVTLSTGGAEVAGTQNDIGFQPQARVAAKANGKPDCAVNGDIDKGATSFAFRPSGCSGEACTGIRALVLSTDNVAAIPNGSVLYTCKVNIAADAAGGDYTLAATGVILSDPVGNAIAGASGQNGTVTVSGGGPEPTPTEVPSAPCDAPAIQAPSFDGQPGTTVEFNVTLKAGTNQVAGTQNDIGFQPQTRIAAKANGKPECAVNGDIDKGATSFAFRPSGCSGEACTGIRALVLSTDNVAAIQDGSVLYTCKVAVAADANATYPLDVTGVILSDPAGNAIEGATGCDGAVVAGTVVVPTLTPTEVEEQPTPTATATPPPAATATITASPAPTQTAKPGQARTTKGASAGDTTLELTNVNGFASSGTVQVEGIAEELEYNSISGKKLILAAGLPAAVPLGTLVTFVPGGAPTVSYDDDDGCQIATRSHGSVAWMLLIPAVGLLVLRRRSR